MKQRINYQSVAPEALQGMFATEKYLAKSSLGHPLIHLIKLRASQMNGCAFCIDMHWKDARAAGETEQRLYGLDAWREAAYYSDRERAALAWTEALTDITNGHAPDAVYEHVKSHLSEREIADLTVAVAQINAWNRISISMRTEPGGYRAKQG